MPKTDPRSPQEKVRAKIRAGKLKKTCCKSKPRCTRCPVRALKKARRKAEKRAAKAERNQG